MIKLFENLQKWWYYRSSVINRQRARIEALEAVNLQHKTLNLNMQNELRLMRLKLDDALKLLHLETCLTRTPQVMEEDR
jgi:hypothetical protein